MEKKIINNTSRSNTWEEEEKFLFVQINRQTKQVLI